MFGLADSAAGLAIVLTHNVWAASWQVLITLIGWTILLRCAARNVAPGVVKSYAKNVLDKYTFFPAAAACPQLLRLSDLSAQRMKFRSEP
jgi:hypothetical protein